MGHEIKNEPLEVLWTTKQVANYLGLSVVTVYRWISEGRVFDPAKIIKFSRTVRVPRSEVERIAGLTKAKLTGEEGKQ